MSNIEGSACSRLEDSSFCWPSEDIARHDCAWKDCAVDGRLHARHTKELEALAVVQKVDMVVIVLRFAEGRVNARNTAI